MSTDLRALLDQLDQAREKATTGPWHAEPNFTGGWALVRARIEDPDGMPVHTPSGWTGYDAALIVAAVNALPRLTAALRAVADLADELDEDLDSYGYRIRNGLDPTPGDRLRAALAPLTAEATQESTPGKGGTR